MTVRSRVGHFMDSRVSRPVIGNIAGLACMLLWATNFPLVAALLETWHPLLIVPARMGIAALTITLFAVAIGQARQLTWVPLRDLVVIGGLALSAGIICLVWAQVFADPVTAAVVISAMPLTSALMGLAQGTEKVTWRIGLGVGLAIAGGVITSLASQEAGFPRALGDSILGAFLLIIGSALYIWHSRALVIRFAHVPDVAKSAVIMVTATLSTLLIAAAAIASGLVPARYDLAPGSLMILGTLGVLTVGASTVLWFVTGRLVGVTVAAMHHNMVPFYVILMSAMTGSDIGIAHVLGAALVILGAVLAQFPRRGPSAGPDGV